MGEFKINVSYEGDNEKIVIIQPHGYIDATTYIDVEKVILNQIAQEYYKIIVNLADCEYVNSSGWGVFIREIKDIRKNNGDLVLVNMHPDVYMVYDTMEFSKILKTFSSLQEGISNFCGDEE
jgi:anti-sigma B factor antagonist